MIRRDTYLHPFCPPATPRQAAALVLLRDTAAAGGEGAGFEVLLSRRSDSARFVPGAYVFPGGLVDAGDAELLEAADARADQDPHTRLCAAAAVRECLEELGLLLARPGGHSQAPLVDAAALAHAGVARQQPLAAQLRQLHWRLALDRLYLFAHWITDRDYPQRYDVPFFAAHAPTNQLPQADGVEQFDPLWITPQEALRRHEAGQLKLVYPTIHSLRKLAQFASAQAVLDACASAGPLIVSCPRVGLQHGQPVRYMEHENPFGELRLVCPDGQPRHDLAWQHERPVPLLRHIQRLTAPNPGAMTGPGTNTYLIGEPATGWAVIDPGPADAAHINRIVQATQAQVRHILCTHSHPDHAPGAALLQAQVVACGQPRPDIAGMASGPHARADSQFTPDVPLQTGDTLVLHGHDAHGAPLRHTLHALHTPGHAANHLCFVLEEDGLLLSGDHILGGTTTVIAAPDGHMQDFLDALDTLDAACQRWAIEFILPAHGHVLHRARQTIAQLKAHRLAREAKILRTIENHPHGDIDSWLAQAYADTPQALWPVARLSLLAHLERLARLHPQLPLQAHLSPHWSPRPRPYPPEDRHSAA